MQETTILLPKLMIKSRKSKFSKHCQEIYTLSNRLIIQTYRQPILVILGIIQPLLWLFLFGALFQNAPTNLLLQNIPYTHFISPGIIVFSSFTSALFSGLPLMFDREFGFLNRLLTTPMISRYCILWASSTNIIITSMIQIICISTICYTCGYPIIKQISWLKICITISALLVLIKKIHNVSLILALTCPGHIELLGLLFTINLPVLFSSTALAPLVFMPTWMQILASTNPLSYVIDIIRQQSFHWLKWQDILIVETVWGKCSFTQIIIGLLNLDVIALILVGITVSNKFEE